MKTVGFPISHKENEYRRAIVPAHLKNIEHPELLYFEKGYGDGPGAGVGADHAADGGVADRIQSLFPEPPAVLNAFR